MTANPRHVDPWCMCYGTRGRQRGQSMCPLLLHQRRRERVKDRIVTQLAATADDH